MFDTVVSMFGWHLVKLRYKGHASYTKRDPTPCQNVDGTRGRGRGTEIFTVRRSAKRITKHNFLATKKRWLIGKSNEAFLVFAFGSISRVTQQKLFSWPIERPLSVPFLWGHGKKARYPSQQWPGGHLDARNGSCACGQRPVTLLLPYASNSVSHFAVIKKQNGRAAVLSTEIGLHARRWLDDPTNVRIKARVHRRVENEMGMSVFKFCALRQSAKGQGREDLTASLGQEPQCKGCSRFLRFPSDRARWDWHAAQLTYDLEICFCLPVQPSTVSERWRVNAMKASWDAYFGRSRIKRNSHGGCMRVRFGKHAGTQNGVFSWIDVCPSTMCFLLVDQVFSCQGLDSTVPTLSTTRHQTLVTRHNRGCCCAYAHLLHIPFFSIPKVIISTDDRTTDCSRF